MVELSRNKKILIAAGSAAVVLAIVLGVSLGTQNKGDDSGTPTSAGGNLASSNTTEGLPSSLRK